MDSQGNYTDAYGARIEVGDLIQVISGFDVRVGAQGTVVSLPKAGNDWHGFPYLAFGDIASLRKHLPETALRRIGTRHATNYLTQAAVQVTMPGVKRMLEDSGLTVTEVADQLIVDMDSLEDTLPGIKEAVANRLGIQFTEQWRQERGH